MDMTQAEAAWKVASNIKRGMEKALHRAKNAKTKEARDRNRFNAQCFHDGWLRQVERAKMLERAGL